MARYLDRTTKQWVYPHPDYGSVEGAIRNPDLSAVDGVPQARWIVEGDVVRAPNSEETAAFDAADLAAAKESRKQQIDNRTGEIIEAGSVNVNGVDISTSLAAQTSLNGMKGLYDIGLLTFPQEVSATNGGVYVINSLNDFKRIVGLVGVFVLTSKAEGRALRAAVLACSTVAEVAAVEDNR